MPGFVGQLREWWRRVGGWVWPGARPAADGTARISSQLRALFQDSQSAWGGEMSARERATRIAALYRDSNLTGRTETLKAITVTFAPGRVELDHALAAMAGAATEKERGRAEAALRLALDAPRAHFLKQFNLLPDGVRFLVELRADLLEVMPQEPQLEVLKVELDDLLTSWFDPGFIELARISWQTPAAVLEKLMAYEAVHPIASWADLRNRLDTDRRCYAFFHPRLPGEPLIFVEIALTQGMPESVQWLLDEQAPLQDPHAADTAVFYSISSAQQGLRGISFGNLLLKRVIEDLQRDLPRLKTFATLSPLPGFRAWLDKLAAVDPELLSRGESAKIAAAFGAGPGKTLLASALEQPDWHHNPRLSESLHAPLERLCARYLLREKSGGAPLDPVAGFHLHNGARVNRIFWLADTSPRGLRQSYGMMASYRYDLDMVDRNHERFSEAGQIAASRRVKRLLD
ncbi:MAG: malonyl-CoA decarboxylase family protein [Betaproteobacteria bacterium]|nr:malonyl-CoA decarboxylase family protein [Betaproteobacteria bacterium]